MVNKIQIFICHYDFDNEKNTCQWMLTTDEIIAKETDQSFELANMDDLMDWAAATGKVFDNCIVTVEEGNCKWVEEDYLDFVGNICWRCEYEIIWQ